MSQLVNDLKEKQLFAKVDLLSPDLRRDLADPKVTFPGEHRVLALDFAATEFRNPVPPRKPLGPASTRTPRHASRSAWPAGDTEETSPEIAP